MEPIRSRTRGRAELLIGAVLAANACTATPKVQSGNADSASVATVTVSTPITDSVTRACLRGVAHASIRDYEPFASADPANPDRIVAVWSASGDSASTILTAASSDGGTTWTAPVALPVQACAGGLAAARLVGDPWVTFAPDGRVYAGAIGMNLTPDRKSLAYNALIVSVSTDGGKSWGAAAVAAPHPGPNVSYDNLELTADPTRPGTVYLASTQYQPTTPGPVRPRNRDRTAGPAAFTRSSDGGKTWTEIRPVTPLIAGARISAPLVVVDPRNGRLHMLYFRERGDSALVAVISSDDQGDHWSDERSIAPFVRLTGEPGTTIRFGGKFRITTAQDILQGAVDPGSGRILVAFSDARHSGGRFLSVSLTSSTDGVTWTEPVQVNPPMEAHAWLPSVAIDSARRLGVSYLDVRGWSADTTKEDIPTEHTLAVFPLGADGTPGARIDYRLDQFNLLGPKSGRGGTGDYQALVGRRRGFVSVYVKHHPAGSTKVSDLMAAR